MCPRDAQAGSGCVCQPLGTGEAAPGTRIEMTVLPPSRTGRKGVQLPASLGCRCCGPELEWNWPESGLRQFSVVPCPAAASTTSDQQRAAQATSWLASTHQPSFLQVRLDHKLQPLTVFPGGWRSSRCSSQAGGALPPSSQSPKLQSV